jgi:adenylate cyclase
MVFPAPSSAFSCSIGFASGVSLEGEIDVVQVRGSKKQVKIYEVFDADEREIFEKKVKLLELFGQALSQYRAGNLREAASRFEECLRILPEDIPSLLYLDRCRKYA